MTGELHAPCAGSIRPRSRKSRICRLTSFSCSGHNLRVGCWIGIVPTAKGVSWQTAWVWPASWSPLLNTSLYFRSNFAIARRSSLLMQPWQASLYKSLTCVKIGSWPPCGGGQRLSVVSPNDGPTSPWTEWNRFTMNPAGSSTDSVKGLTHCVEICPRAVSWFKLLASCILSWTLSITPSLEISLRFTLQWVVAWERPGIVQLSTTCTPPTSGQPNLSTQVSSC